jgi:hypothetical protein
VVLGGATLALGCSNNGASGGPDSSVSGGDGGQVADGGTTTPDAAVSGGAVISATAIGRTINAGSEEEWCELVILDNPDPIKVNHVKFTIDDASHHGIVSLVEPSSPWNNAPAGYQIKGAGCNLPGSNDNPILVGTQTNVLDYDFPTDVYFPLPAHAKLVFNYHYINTGTAPIHTNVMLELHHDDVPRNIQAAALFYNWTNFAAIPMGQASSQTKVCTLANAGTVFTLNGHQHKLGTKFEAYTIKGGVENLVYTNTNWDNPLYKVYTPPIDLAVGDQLKFTCTWQNTTTRDVSFGVTTNDEMCILGGYIYPAPAGVNIVSNCN